VLRIASLAVTVWKDMWKMLRVNVYSQQSVLVLSMIMYGFLEQLFHQQMVVKNALALWEEWSVHRKNAMLIVAIQNGHLGLIALPDVMVVSNTAAGKITVPQPREMDATVLRVLQKRDHATLIHVLSVWMKMALYMVLGRQSVMNHVINCIVMSTTKLRMKPSLTALRQK